MASNDFDTVIIQNVEYKIPKPNANPPNGEELNDLLHGLTDAINTLVGPGDIKESAQAILNNQTSQVNITLLNFDSAIIGAIDITYRVSRSTDSESFVESGTLFCSYKPNGVVGQKWTLGREIKAGDYAQIDFFMSDSGQISYTTTNMVGANYTGLIKFEAKAILQSS